MGKITSHISPSLESNRVRSFCYVEKEEEMHPDSLMKMHTSSSSKKRKRKKGGISRGGVSGGQAIYLPSCCLVINWTLKVMRVRFKNVPFAADLCEKFAYLV